jgi:hypothetical protein
MKRGLVVTAICAVAMLGIGPCPAESCGSSCKQILDLCKVACPSSVAGFAGFEGTRSFCEDNPETAGCSSLLSH